MNGKDDDRMKKYELTNEIKNLPGGVVLYRIRALKDFADVKAGDLGGFIQKESNLAQDGYAWVDGDARVSGDARVCGNARVSGNAWVRGDAYVAGYARVDDNAWMSGRAQMGGNAWVSGYTWMSGDAWACGAAKVDGTARVDGDARVTGDAWVSGDDDYCLVKGFGHTFRTSTFFRCKDGKVRVQCGCFYGDLDEFRAKVKETHGDGKMAREYLMIADLMELHFKKE